uniref:Ubiquitin-like domain-containing protein n=1 Tax=Erythrolobus madagascarensis TaxID=708628 RepID=A0A7S0T8P1_9RHOD
MKVTVLVLTSREHRVEVNACGESGSTDADATVQDVRSALFSQKELGLAPKRHRLRLIFRGKMLNDPMETLKAAGVRENDVLHCTVSEIPQQRTPTAPRVKTAARRQSAENSQRLQRDVDGVTNIVYSRVDEDADDDEVVDRELRAEQLMVLAELGRERNGDENDGLEPYGLLEVEPGEGELSISLRARRNAALRRLRMILSRLHQQASSRRRDVLPTTEGLNSASENEESSDRDGREREEEGEPSGDSVGTFPFYIDSGDEEEQAAALEAFFAQRDGEWSDFIWGVLLGFFLGVIMLIVSMDRGIALSNKWRAGILFGVALNLFGSVSMLLSYNHRRLS